MFPDNIFTASRGRTACLVAVLLGAPLVFYFTRETSEGADSASSSNARVVPPLKLTVMSSHDQHVVNLRGLDLTQPAIPDTITKEKETKSITEHRIKIEVILKAGGEGKGGGRERGGEGRGGEGRGGEGRGGEGRGGEGRGGEGRGGEGRGEGGQLSFAAIHAVFIMLGEAATMVTFPCWFQCEASSMNNQRTTSPL